MTPTSPHCAPSFYPVIGVASDANSCRRSNLWISMATCHPSLFSSGPHISLPLIFEASGHIYRPMMVRRSMALWHVVNHDGHVHSDVSP